MSTWKVWREQEGRDPHSEVPFCAMYLVRSPDEPIGEMFSEDWNTETVEGRLRFSEVLKERQSAWKRVKLILAVWPDGKSVQSSESADEKDSFPTSRIDQSQTVGLVRSLESFDLFRQPLSETRRVYPDVSYWVVEISHGTTKVHLESWERQPAAKNVEAGSERFCAVWNCVVAWIDKNLDRVEDDRYQACSASGSGR